MQRHNNNGLRILMLVTDAHGGFGGIAQFNRDVIEAMSGLSSVENVTVLPRIVQDPKFIAPKKVNYDLAGAESTLAYLRRCAYYFFGAQKYDVIYCAHINLMPLAIVLSRLRKIPVVLAIYGIDAWKKPASRVAAVASRMATLVVSISQITVERFRDWSNFDAEKCALLPNAIHLDQYGTGSKRSALAERLGVANCQVILTFGRMSADERYKGFDEVIELMPRLCRKLPNLVYVAAGDGTDRQRLEVKAKALGVDGNVIFPGRINEDEKAELYRLADAYVMPSSGEGFGFVVLEALACGIPVVASTADGTREAARNGELGLLVDPKDPEALERAILESLEKPQFILPGLEYFSFSNFQSRLENILNRLLPVNQ